MHAHETRSLLRVRLLLSVKPFLGFLKFIFFVLADLKKIIIKKEINRESPRVIGTREQFKKQTKIGS